MCIASQNILSTSQPDRKIKYINQDFPSSVQEAAKNISNAAAAVKVSLEITKTSQIKLNQNKDSIMKLTREVISTSSIIENLKQSSNAITSVSARSQKSRANRCICDML